MSKEKFLESLRKKLSILEESEIEDILTEYEGYIEEKITQGSTEEEAVKSMGNVNELAKDLLSAYKIKTEEGKNQDTFNSLVDSFMNVFDRIISVFAHKSFQEIVRFILELVFIFIIIAICKIPFEIIESMGRGIFESFGVTGFRVVNGIWNFILEFAYLIFAVLLFIKIFESRYLNEEFESVLHPKKESEFKSEKPKKEKKNFAEEKPKNTIERKPAEHKGLGIIDALTSICVLFVKFILLMVLFGVSCYLIGMAMAVGISVYFLIRGVFYFGIYIIILSLFTLGILAFIFLFNFIFNHKNKLGVLLITFLVSFVLLGVGTGICALEFASTNIIYTEEKENLHNEEYKFTMQDNLLLTRNLYSDNVLVDDTLGKEIKVVYTYNDNHMKIVANPYIGRENKYNILHTSYSVSEFKYTKEFFEHFIDNLKKKTIVASSFNDVEVKIYVSSDTLNQLKENELKQQKENFPEDLEEICDDLERNGYSLPHYCEPFYHHHNM